MNPTTLPNLPREVGANLPGGVETTLDLLLLENSCLSKQIGAPSQSYHHFGCSFMRTTLLAACKHEYMMVMSFLVSAGKFSIVNTNDIENLEQEIKVDERFMVLRIHTVLLHEDNLWHAVENYLCTIIKSVIT